MSSIHGNETHGNDKFDADKTRFEHRIFTDKALCLRISLNRTIPLHEKHTQTTVVSNRTRVALRRPARVCPTLIDNSSVAKARSWPHCQLAGWGSEPDWIPLPRK